jgi:hypothetical protein
VVKIGDINSTNPRRKSATHPATTGTPNSLRVCPRSVNCRAIIFVSGPHRKSNASKIQPRNRGGEIFTRVVEETKRENVSAAK